MENMHLSNSLLGDKEVQVSDRLKALRLKNDFPTAAPARVLGVDCVYYESVEDGITACDPAWIPKLARFYGVPEETIMVPTEHEVEGRDTLTCLTEELVATLEKINRIRPVQFYGTDTGYTYNFLRLHENSGDDRVYVELSRKYDNLPAHEAKPFEDRSGRPVPPNREMYRPVRS